MPRIDTEFKKSTFCLMPEIVLIPFNPSLTVALVNELNLHSSVIALITCHGMNGRNLTMLIQVERPLSELAPTNHRFHDFSHSSSDMRYYEKE